MKPTSEIAEILSYLDPNLKSELSENAIIKEIPGNVEILREGQYVKVIPVVLEGLIKVYSKHEDRELLLYYIRPKESCIMSFAASLENSPSRIYAETEEDTRALLLPIEKVSRWIKQYPEFNTLFFKQYNLRYSELLNTIHAILFMRMDKRLYDHLKEKAELINSHSIKISHRQIANELGTAREVISRVMKKLENEGKVKQHTGRIEIL